MIQKPDKIYQDPKTVAEVTEMFTEMSFADKLKLYTQLQQEVAPTPVIEEVVPALGDEEVREMVLDEWERKEVVEEEPEEEEKSAISPGMIRFNPPGTEFGKPLGWDKPEGWDKKPSFLQVLWGGIIDRDMDPSDYKRYDVFVNRIRPLIIIIVIALISYGAYRIAHMETERGDAHRSDSYIDRVMNWGREQYDNYTGRNSPVQGTFYDSTPTKTKVKTAPLRLTRPTNAPVELLTARDSGINYIP